MAGGNEDPEDSMESDGCMDSTEHSECDLSDVGDMEFYDDANEYCSVHSNLKDDIRKALATFPQSEEELGIPSVQIDETRTNLKYISAVVLTFTLKDIYEHLLELWDLVDTPAIIMEMDNIHRGDFRTYGQLPTITVKKHSSDGAFLVGEQLKNFALRLCRESYSLRANESPEVVGSFFRLVYGQVKERLMRLSEYCVTCGEILSCGGVLPSICDRDLCMYQYSELHLFDGLSVPRVSPEVLSLLLFAFSNANLSPRRKDILTPAPPIRSLKDLLDEAKEKRLARKGELGDAKNASSEEMKGSTYWNYTVTNAQVQNTRQAFNSTESATFSVLLENMPCPREFLASVSSYHQFRKEWPQMSDIVDWLVISNRSYLEMVPRPMSVDFLHTDSQYCFVSDTPAKQAEFDKLVAESGGKTRFFFHGSPLDNWHSIIRAGLKNMSGTKYQLVGAAYGQGIYLSPFLDFALGYASRGAGGPFARGGGARHMTQDRPIRSDCRSTACCDTERNEDLACVALVEVVDCPEAYKEKTDEIFVVEKEEWCSIRMLLLYRQSDINKLQEAVDKVWTRDYHSRGYGGAAPRATARLRATAASAGITTIAPPTTAPAGAAGGLPQPPIMQAPHMATSSSGLMSYMMNKFSTWTGGTNAATGQQPMTHLPYQMMPYPSAAPAPSGAPSGAPSTGQPGSRELIAKLAEGKKIGILRRVKEQGHTRLKMVGVVRIPPPAPSNSPTHDPASSARHAPTALPTDDADPTSMPTADADQGGRPTSAPGTLDATASASVAAVAKLGATSKASSSGALVDLTKEEEEEDRIVWLTEEVQAGSSGLQKDAEKERRQRLKMALGDDSDGVSSMSEDEEMSAARRERRERREKREKRKKMGGGKDKTPERRDKKKGKNLFKRKRFLSDGDGDASSDVPKKTASSPSNDKNGDKADKKGLTEEDLKILEMFAESDLGEDDDVQVLGEVPRRKKVSFASKSGGSSGGISRGTLGEARSKKGGGEAKKEREADSDGTDDDEIIMIVSPKASTHKNKDDYEKYWTVNPSSRKNQLEKQDDIMGTGANPNAEQDEGKKGEKKEEDDGEEKKDDKDAGGSASATTATPYQYAPMGGPSPYTFYGLPPTSLGYAPSQPGVTLPMTGPPPPGSHQMMSHAAFTSAQQQQQMMMQLLMQQQQQVAMPTPISKYSSQQQAAARRTAHHQLQMAHSAAAMAAAMQQAPASMAGAPPPPLSAMLTPAAQAAHGIPPPPLPAGSAVLPPQNAPPSWMPFLVPPGPMAPGGPPGPSGLFQMMGTMISRRRRRRGGAVEGGAPPIPGDLTTITDEQREQIARVVRMFRNSGFEERVNRHMNREEKKDGEDGEGGNEIDEEEEEMAGSPSM